MLSRRREERGAAAVMVALVTCFVLFIVAALTVDIGNSWARRGQLQFQVDRAAKFAAEKLPVDSTTVAVSPSASQLGVAQAAAYFMACHAVAGQDDLSTIPSCPSGDYTSDSGIQSFARSLLNNGRTSSNSSLGAVSFPAVNKVTIRAPDALVSFGFGRAVGADSTTQRKSATAVVLSPGQILPVGMSLSCVANALGNAPLTGQTTSTVLPVNYISAGYTNQSGALTVTPNTYSGSQANFAEYPQGATAAITLGQVSMNLNGSANLSFSWSQTKNGFVPYQVDIVIRKVGWVTGDPTYTTTRSTVLVFNAVSGKWTQVSPLPNPVAFSLSLPSGDYEALVQLTGVNESSPVQHPVSWANMAAYNAKFHIPKAGDLANFVSCSRPVQSPRLGLTDNPAMSVNFSQGLDHGLAAFPGLGDAVDALRISGGASVPSAATLLGTVPATFACANNSNAKLDYPTRRTDGANCLHVDTRTDWSLQLTEGLLTGGTFATGSINGRLKCPASRACNFKTSRPVLSNPGGIAGSYNDDRFGDFIKPSSSYLNDPFAMSLDLFISPSLPLVTPPNDTIDQALYSSPRFFWAPLMVTAYVDNSANDYPVMTFRPVFLTPDSATTSGSPVDMLLLDLVRQSTASGYSLLQTLQNFGNPCPTQLTAAQLLTAILTTAQLQACETMLLKTTDPGGMLTAYFGSNIEVTGGLVIDKAAGRVRAARIMTLTPGSLPAPSTSYNGPTTDYLGVGPKIIRLTK